MKTKGRVFLLDDDELIVSMLARALKGEGYEVQAETDPRGVTDKLRAFGPDAVLLDIKLPGKSGLDLLKEWVEGGVARQIVMLTSDDSAETAVAAMKLGAADYVTKPFNLDEVKIVVRGVVEKGALKQEVDYLRKISAELTQREIIGESAAIRELKHKAARLAEARVNTILLTGESGCGKEVFARYIHNLMYGGDQGTYSPFIAINCAALPETLIESELFGHEKGSFTDAKADKKGVFELASRGSILLDEIGEMQPLLQSKLLRVIEERHVRRLGGRQDIPIDATVFATTNKNLTEAVENGEFRSDLFYRMNAFSLGIPPIRERPEDIKSLALHFLRHFCTKYQRLSLRDFSAEADEALVSYSWPGNVRELRNVIERIVVLESGDTVLPSHLPRALVTRGPAASHAITLPDEGIAIEAVEKSLIAQALEKAEGNKTLAAKLLHMTYDSLRYQIKKYGLE